MSATRLHNELSAWLSARHAEKAKVILAGGLSPELYRERCAELRMIEAMAEELGKALKRAKD
jgi:phosphoribosylanthranilate isomerase